MTLDSYRNFVTIVDLSLIHIFQFLGYQIPKDVSVVGFDDIPASERITPSLTTIQTPKKYLGIAAVSYTHLFLFL